MVLLVKEWLFLRGREESSCIKPPIMPTLHYKIGSQKQKQKVTWYNEMQCNVKQCKRVASA